MGRLSSRGARRQDGSIWRIAAIVVLLAAAAAGATTRRALRPHGFGGLGTLVMITALMSALVVVGAAVLVLRLIARAQRPRGDDAGAGPSRGLPRLGSLHRAIVFAAALGIAAVAALLAFLLARLTFGAPSPSASVHTPRPRPATSHLAGPTTPWKTWVIAALIAAAVVVTVVLVARRLGRPAPVVDDGSEREVGFEDVVAGAAAHGKQLLLSAATPRDAVLAAYLAVEHDLAERGFALAVNRTPREILLGSGVGTFPQPEAAARLAGLFELARYSEQPVTEHHRDAALDALDRLTGQVPR